MSVKSEITRLTNAVASAYTQAAAKGATMPTTQNAANLASTIASIQSGVTAADYVVEQGTSGKWTYRKWNSGIGECWGIFSTDNITVSSAWGQVYYGGWMGTTVNKTARQYPFAFIEDPIVETSLYTTEGDGWLAPDTNNNYGTLRTYAPAYCLVRPTSGRFVLPRISYHVTGRWK